MKVHETFAQHLFNWACMNNLTTLRCLLKKKKKKQQQQLKIVVWKYLWKYVWVKKCIEMREMLFKNWKWLFKITNQTPPKIFKIPLSRVLLFVRLFQTFSFESSLLWALTVGFKCECNSVVNPKCINFNLCHWNYLFQNRLVHLKDGCILESP